MGWRGRAGGVPGIFPLLLFVFFLTSGFVKPHEGYLKSATYYSDDWVVNFWNGESDHMEEELRQIREDGFNSIILVIPWREFQPDALHFQDYAFSRLHTVMDKAGNEGLSVLLRVGYSWDYGEGRSSIDRANELPFNEPTRKQWFSYLKKLYEEASRHENFAGGFITWEDFWSFKVYSTTLGSGSGGILKARQSGYMDFARSRYSMEELRALYQDPKLTEDTIYFPSKSSPARKVFFAWYDDFLLGLLRESQSYFPDLTMETRLDGDEVYHGYIGSGEDSYDWYSHQATFGVGDASYAATMYAVQMFTGEGTISVERALEGMRQALTFARTGGKDLYVEQFLFTDNTPGYEENGRLRAGDKPSYLLRAAPILKELSLGYGIWTYRNYGNNKLFNAQFALGKEGWDFQSGAEVVEKDGSHVAALHGGSSITQKFSPSDAAAFGNATTVRFQLEGDGKAVVHLICDDVERHRFTAGEKGYVEHRFDGKVGKLTLSCESGRAYIDNLNVYTFVTEGDLYKLDGSEDSCIAALREMNRQLDMLGAVQGSSSGTVTGDTARTITEESAAAGDTAQAAAAEEESKGQAAPSGNEEDAGRSATMDKRAAQTPDEEVSDGGIVEAADGPSTVIRR